MLNLFSEQVNKYFWINMHPGRNIKWEQWKGQFREHMYPEQVKQIEFITPCAESGINESLVAETSERVCFVNLIIQT